jgi:hypothetical protein
MCQEDHYPTLREPSCLILLEQETTDLVIRAPRGGVPQDFDARLVLRYIETNCIERAIFRILRF